MLTSCRAAKALSLGWAVALLTILFAPASDARAQTRLIPKGDKYFERQKKRCEQARPGACEKVREMLKRSEEGRELAKGALSACKKGELPRCEEFKALSTANALQTWQRHFRRAKKPLDRVTEAPTALAEYLVADNALRGRKTQSKSVSLPRITREKVLETYRRIPAPVRALTDGKLMGFTVVRELGSSARMLEIHDKSGHTAAYLMILDQSLLDRDPNEWATERESSAFRSDGNYTLSIEIIENKETPSSAGTFPESSVGLALLKEIGRILALEHSLLPRKLAPTRVKILGKDWDGVNFFRLSWQMSEGTPVSKFDSAFPQRRALAPQATPDQRLPSVQIPATYQALSNTNFPTLRAAISPAEDFSESFATYVHAVLRKRPYRYLLRKKGTEPKIIESCWKSPRCEDKKAFFKSFVGE